MQSSSELKRLAIVEFMTHEEAVAVLLKRRITIGNHKIIVEPCKEANFKKYCSAEVSQRIKVDDMLLLQPPDRESSKNILNVLNDDCLYEVFERIHPSNYHLIADVCVRFNQVLTEMLARKYKENMFRVSDLQSFTLPEAQHYLRYFGSSIYQAEIDGNKLKKENRLKILIILRMISEHCLNLLDFHIINFGMEKETANEIIPLFTRIREISIEKTGTGKIVNRRDPVFLPSINCSKLTTFYWYDNCIYKNKYITTEDIRALVNFLYYNPQLTKFLYSDDPKYGDVYGNRSRSSLNHLPMNIPVFGRLISLKSLTIINQNNPCISKKQLFQVTKLMQEITVNNVPIEFLNLSNTLIDDATIEYICQMKTMKKFIYLDHNFMQYKRSPARNVIESYIICLESNLPNLEFLQFRTSHFFDLVFTDELINLIQKRLQNLIKIKINLNLLLQHFNSDAFTDKYNLTTIQTTYRNKLYGDCRVTMRKVKRIFVFCFIYIKYLNLNFSLIFFLVSYY